MAELSPDVGFLAADIYGAFFMLLGTLLLMGFLKYFGGSGLRKYAVTAGAGMLLFSVLHEGGDFICGSGIHGGMPRTLYGSVHIVILGTMGPVIFFIGCYMFQKKYMEFVKGE